MLRYAWTCRCCGRQHDELPIHWMSEAPTPYEAMPEEERAGRTELSADFCTIHEDDGEAFFVRATIEIALAESEDPFTWGVWVSLSRTSMETVRGVWDSADRARHGPFFGWLCTALPAYPATVGLKTMIHLNPRPFSPSVELEPTDHPLALEQRDGMTLARAVAIAEAVLTRH